ncbi:MAG: DUF370 domain-containing protein [Ruminococcus flavefaciens]|nr:DUF370 domain-containing protein [Ruminococcus flavefaciens]MCM1060250.1 DUF370 domain-containing protein [Eubacterium sp.]
MYLHIGNNYSVDVRDIVAIFDIENTTVGKSTKILLDRAEKEHKCVYTTYEMPKSFIITMKNGRERVYISQLAASTLRKRLESGGGY